MREIKFRARRKLNNEWVYGSYVKGPVEDTDFMVMYIDESLSESDHVTVITKTVGQYTCLHDKNGKEIYEGDILTFYDRPIAVVEWQDFGGWSYRWIDETYKRVRQCNPETFFRNINLWEVIGNIYENPELLTN